MHILFVPLNLKCCTSSLGQIPAESLGNLSELTWLSSFQGWYARHLANLILVFYLIPCYFCSP
uniref:Uncharacterized protein n=1 Tax=Arundo donax TaxID=35708 RepID=A0A0A9DUW6_ARUDO